MRRVWQSASVALTMLVAGPASASAAEISPLVAEMPRSAESSIESVGIYIRSREPDPRRRLKAIHDWVADRIAYDARAFADGHIPDEDTHAETVFARRVGVCSGYAALMIALGRVTGDTVVEIRGFMPGAGYHAWNAAWVNDKWIPIDATWDAGYVLDGEFHKQYTASYFLSFREHLLGAMVLPPSPYGLRMRLTDAALPPWPGPTLDLHELDLCLDGDGAGCQAVGDYYEHLRDDPFSASKWYRMACDRASSAGCAAVTRVADARP